MSVSRPTAWLRSQFPTRPHTAPDFLLSRPHGSVRTQGVRDVPQSIAAAATALRTGDAEMVVGALPFDPEQPAALTIPERIVRELASCTRTLIIYRARALGLAPGLPPRIRTRMSTASASPAPSPRSGRGKLRRSSWHAR